MKILETDRLVICKVRIEDAPFILKLFNDDAWQQFLDNKGVRTLDDAKTYILNHPLKEYEKRGFGLFITRLKSDMAPIGICGLLKRDYLDDVDIGFGLLSTFCGKGFAQEAASAMLAHGRNVYGLERIVATVDPENAKSENVLRKIGLTYERMVHVPKDNKDLRLFS